MLENCLNSNKGGGGGGGGGVLFVTNVHLEGFAVHENMQKV